MSEALMQEVRYDGIKVSYIMPGSVATQFSGTAPGPEDARKIQPQDIARIVLDLLNQEPTTRTSADENRPSKPPSNGWKTPPRPPAGPCPRTPAPGHRSSPARFPRNARPRPPERDCSRSPPGGRARRMP